MSKKKQVAATITLQGSEIAVVANEMGEFISLTEMVKNFEGGSALIEQWLKNTDTVLSWGAGGGSTTPGLIPPNSRELKQGCRIHTDAIAGTRAGRRSVGGHQCFPRAFVRDRRSIHR